MRTRSEPGGAPRAISPWALLRGLLFAFLTAGLLAVALTLVAHFSRLSDPVLARSGFFAGLLAPLAGGMAAGRSAEQMGWLHGGLAGLGYVLLLLLVDWAAGGAGMGGTLLRDAGLGLALGALGGMLGVAL
ncbi:MAG: TIGR04086 family membrane protein [Bacillota bacterium]|nr:TIGR04086 family membrane protein [Bacillota bacterium]